MTGIIEGIVIIIILLFSVVFHEVAHGWAAFALGDKTAKHAGRLTLNPIKHLDPFGSIILPGILILLSLASGGGGIIFGWAKPVPINPLNFRDRKYGMAKSAVAGPLANILLALIFGLILRFGIGIIPEPAGIVFAYIVQINLILAIFNLLPIPPLDGSHILFTFLPNVAKEMKIALARYGIFILIFIIFFLGQYFFGAINFIFRLIVGI